MEKWKFTEITRTEELSFHNVLERFHANKISGLIRESIQNSLDGKNHELDKPVRVTINTGQIPVNELPGIEEIHKRIAILNGGNSYAKKTVSYMQKVLDRKEVPFISIEDENTKGLSGALSKDKEGTFYSYAYNKGVHLVDEDVEKEKLRGGSHGIGKIAFNAASDINVMYFSNCDMAGQQHICGSAQLIEHEYNGKCYRATGYFTDEVGKLFIPYENNYEGIFSKRTCGLKIVVPYLRSTYQNQQDLIRSICDSFFLSIVNGDLIVKYNDLLVNDQTIESYIYSQELYELELNAIKEHFTPLYYQTLRKDEGEEIEVEDMKNIYRFRLHFDYDEEIKNGRTAIIRTIGMKIEDFKVKGKVRKPYNAVLIPMTSKEDAFLKSLENESHTELSFEHIKDPSVQKNAKRFINNLSKSIGLIIDDYISKNNPVDGKIDTSDIIYDIENKFRTELEKNNSILRVNIGDKKVNLVKSGKENRDKKRNSDKSKEKKTTKKTRTKNIGRNTKKRIYNVEPSMIKRIASGDQEVMRIDFKDNPILSKLKRCNLHYWYIDGMGKEHVIDYDLRKHIKSVKALNSESNIQINENVLKNIPVMNGQIDLSLDLSERYNRAMKFAYYLEVKE